MTDYIKAGVELADGWSYRSNKCQLLSDRSKPGSFWIKADGPPKHPGCHIDNAFPVYIDALAAQLVRQVDATDNWFESLDDGEAIVWNRDGSGKIAKASEPNGRTMNTIKAIVDSGVLK